MVFEGVSATSGAENITPLQLELRSRARQTRLLRYLCMFNVVIRTEGSARVSVVALSLTRRWPRRHAMRRDSGQPADAADRGIHDRSRRAKHIQKLIRADAPPGAGNADRAGPRSGSDSKLCVRAGVNLPTGFSSNPRRGRGGRKCGDQYRPVAIER